jgi:adenylate cyclase
VRWAIEMQQGVNDRNADVPEDKRIRFRVGINLGDVIVDDKDLYGAVNIAAPAAGRAPSDSVICARLALAKTRPSAISAESAIIRLRNVARMTGGSGPYVRMEVKPGKPLGDIQADSARTSVMI